MPATATKNKTSSTKKPVMAKSGVKKTTGTTTPKTRTSSVVFDIDPKKGKHLVIVESPAKCKTIAKYL